MTGPGKAHELRLLFVCLNITMLGGLCLVNSHLGHTQEKVTGLVVVMMWKTAAWTLCEVSTLSHHLTKVP